MVKLQCLQKAFLVVFINVFKKQNPKDIEDNKYTYKSGVIYIDIITICEDIGDHLMNINEAISLKKQELISGHEQ